MAKLWLECNYDNNTESTKPEHKNRAEKLRTVLKWLFTMGTYVS